MSADPKLASPEQLAALVVPATLPGVVRQGTALIWRGVRVVYIESCLSDAEALRIVALHVLGCSE